MATEVETLQQQVEELQAQLAFQEDTLSGLDAALAQQQQEVLLLRRQVQLLHERLTAQAGGQLGVTQGDETPPHY